MYQLLIIEDADDDAATLAGHIARYAREFSLEFQVTRYRTAVEFIRAKRSFDVIFMDIDLPGVNGMEAAELLRTYDERTPLIFVTNLAQYAVKGYEVDALDFIVKPVSYYNFSMRMDKAVRAMRRNERSHLTVSTRLGVRVVPLDDLVYVETLNHDLVYHLADDDSDSEGGEPLRVRGSLSKLEEELAGGAFLRISSSCLVNMAHIRSIQAGTLKLSNGETLYASRAKKRTTLETFADYLGGSI